MGDELEYWLKRGMFDTDTYIGAFNLSMLAVSICERSIQELNGIRIKENQRGSAEN